MSSQASKKEMCPDCGGPYGAGSNHEYLNCLEVQVSIRDAEIQRLTAALAACQTYDYRQIIEESDRLRAENRIMRGLLVVGPNADDLIDQRIRDELAAETGAKCPECGMSPAFDGMWHKPGCSMPSADIPEA